MLYLKYQPNNWLTSQTLGSGVTTSYAYNPRGFLADLRTTAPQSSGGAVIAEFGGTVGTSSAMTYDAVGNRTRMAGVLNAVGGYQLLGNGPSSSQYAYNSANELTQEQTSQPGNGSYTNGYTYDGAQNRTSLNGNAIGHNQDNQFSDTTHYGYDGNGNPTGYTSPGNPVSGSANTNTFDPENRMTAYGVSGSSALLSATYDSDGLRASKTNSSGTTYYVYDQQDRPVVELNASGAAIFVNTFGDNGLLSRRDVANSLTTYYAFDPQGSAVDVMQGNTGLPSAYSAFGIPASGSAGTGGPFGFGAQWGYYTDAETGLILCTHRYYDPYTGRWLTRDPIGPRGGINLYNYTAGDPIDSSDSSGCMAAESGCKEASIVNAGIAEACRKIASAPFGPKQTPISSQKPCISPAEKSCLEKLCHGGSIVKCDSKDCTTDQIPGAVEEGYWDGKVITLCMPEIKTSRYNKHFNEVDETAYVLIHEMLHECGRKDTGGMNNSNPAGDGANCCFEMYFLNMDG